MIICVFSDVPSQVAQEVHPCLVDRSHGLNCDRHKQVGLAEHSIGINYYYYYYYSVCLFVSWITQNLFNQISQNSMERWHNGQGRNK